MKTPQPLNMLEKTKKEASNLSKIFKTLEQKQVLGKVLEYVKPERNLLEQIISTDITATKQTIRSNHAKKTKEIESRIEYELKTAPRTQIYVKAWEKANENSKKAKKALAKIGLQIDFAFNSEKTKLYPIHPLNNKEIKRITKHTIKTLAQLDDLKRTYTLKLFAGGAEATEIFKTLAKDLAKIVK
jgi:hypothetical protein